MLKEWSSVVGALESGEQCVILRKGGILEAASGFHIPSKQFWLYPTWEHQAPENIREPFRRHLGREQPAEGTNALSSYAKVIDEVDIGSAEVVRKLEPFHIWSSEYVESRRRWKPHMPIKAILLRIFCTPPKKIPILDEYIGCKSWLESDNIMDGGRPAIDDASMYNIMEQFGEIVR